MLVHPTVERLRALTAMAGVLSVGSNWVRRSSINPAQKLQPQYRASPMTKPRSCPYQYGYDAPDGRSEW